MALGLGAVGGVTGLLGLFDQEAPPVAAAPDGRDAAGASVPAPVTGMAELAVEDWLTATEEDSDLLDETFVEEVALPPADEDDSGADMDLDVRRVTAVSGHLVQAGYWVVTVRAEVVEEVEGEPAPPATWFVEIGIVGDVSSGLAPLSTPGILPAPSATFDDWGSSRPSMRPPSDDDPLATAVQGFLDALLTGRSDPAPYLAPGAVVPMASEPPFADAVVEQIAAEEQENGDWQVWVDVTATTPGGREQPVAYELVATRRGDNWEIRFVWGAPSLGSAPAST